ncbi:DUF2069 domain-containing protein [Bermanella marisrubri]|uniref:Uncharacterized protein n=1 Tax=Bermanella marisrubri TaxID=207949 RepID=Q1N6W3_9GAMM|nr:DUF2069 domain-containing protein [Bermanella marisrubri]EAT13479.1 hypothetical protein RED65_08814 [Oceanobacter sp. RED65] [Bermanella marisrubri]QIZ84282.1 DUF2069 domain-containing protein [Bermanella marisrubri]
MLSISYRIAMVCFFLQFVVLGIGTFDRPDIQIESTYDILLGVVWTLIKGIPWLILIPGLIKNTKNIMAWMSYVCMFYFIVWILASFGDEKSNLGTAGVVITTIQFVFAAIHTRLRKQAEAANRK